jgi:hypothetical protein
MKVSLNVMKTNVPRDKATAMRLTSNGFKVDKNRKPFTPDPKRQVQPDDEGYRPVIKSRNSTPEEEAKVTNRSGGITASVNLYYMMQEDFEDEKQRINITPNHICFLSVTAHQ